MDCSREQFGQIINRDSIIQTFVYITLSLYPSSFFLPPPRGVPGCVVARRRTLKCQLYQPPANMHNSVQIMAVNNYNRFIYMCVLVAELQSTSENDWSVSQNKRFRASIIVWGMPKSLSTLEIRAKLADIGLASFARGSVDWEGDHVRLLLLPKDSKGLSKDVDLHV